MEIAMAFLLAESPATNLVVDCRGDVCAGPCLAAKKAVAAAKIGDVVEIITNESSDLTDAFDGWARKTGHEFLGYRDGDGYERIFIRRGR